MRRSGEERERRRGEERRRERRGGWDIYRDIDMDGYEFKCQ